MMDTVALVASCALIAGGDPAGVPHGVCLLDRESLEAALAGDGVPALLDEHARGHGWPVAYGWPAVVAAEHDVPCRADVLDLLVASLGVRSAHADAYVVQALERNGRVDDALTLLREELARAADGPAGAFASSWLALTATECAARAGRDTEALAFAESFAAREGTRGADWLERIHRLAPLVAGAQLRLGRLGAVELPMRTAWGAWGRHTDARVALLWIEHELAAGRAATAELAVAKRILPLRPLANQACDDALALWRWLHGDLADFAADTDHAQHHDLVARRLLALDHDARAALLRHAVGTTRDALRHSPLLHVGARLGLPEVEVRFDALTTGELGSLRGLPELWRRANVPWRLGRGAR